MIWKGLGVTTTLLLLICLVQETRGQAITITSPTGGSTIALTFTQVEIHTDLPIDPTSILDTIPRRDTIIPNRHACIYIVPTILYDSLHNDRSSLRDLCLSGTTMIIDDTTVIFTLDSGQFLFSTDYTILVHDLRVVDTTATPDDTIMVDSTVATFRSADPANALTFTSLDDTEILRCDESPWFRFSKKVPYHTVGGSDLFTVLRIASHTLVDSASVTYSYDTIGYDVAYSSDSTSLTLSIDTLIPGDSYIIEANISLLNGDSTTNFQFPFSVPKVSFFYPKVICSDTSITMPKGLVTSFGSYGGFPVESGDTVRFRVPSEFDNFYFSHWIFPSDSSIDGNTSDSIDLIFTCGMMDFLQPTAVFNLIPIDTFQIASTDTSMGTVKVSGFLDSLGGNTYTVRRGRSNALYLNALPNLGYRFNQWTSLTYSAINGLTSPHANVVTNNPWTNPPWKRVIDGDYDPVICNNHKITVLVDGWKCNHWPDNYEVEFVPKQPANLAFGISNPVLAAVTPYSGQGNIQQQIPITNYMVTYTLYDDCYEIAGATIDGQLVQGTMDCYDGPVVGQTITIPVSTTVLDCDKFVFIHIRHKRFTLRTEMWSVDGSKIIRPRQDVKRSPTGMPKNPYHDWTRNSDFTLWVLEEIYPCNEEVVSHPDIDATDRTATHIQRHGWLNTSGYTYQAELVETPDEDRIEFVMDQDRDHAYLWGMNAFLATRLLLRSYGLANMGENQNAIALRSVEIDELGEPDIFKLDRYRAEFIDPSPDTKLEVFVEFTHPVDAEPNNNGYSFPTSSLWGQDVERYDFEGKRSYQQAPSQYSTSTASLNLVAADGLIPFSCGRVRINWDADIRSSEATGGLPLENPGSGVIIVSPPAIDVQWLSVDTKWTLGDWWDISWQLFIPFPGNPDPRTDLSLSHGYMMPDEDRLVVGDPEFLEWDRGDVNGPQWYDVNDNFSTLYPRSGSSAFFVGAMMVDDDQDETAKDPARALLEVGFSTLDPTSAIEMFVSQFMLGFWDSWTRYGDGDNDAMGATHSGKENHKFANNLWNARSQANNVNYMYRVHTMDHYLYDIQYKVSLSRRVLLY
ncbi:MAG: hypothetical protein IPH49_11060 [Ignavibacteria bacterium]|nr:hypothetical protein [Ignavibacteria bacterium]